MRKWGRRGDVSFGEMLRWIDGKIEKVERIAQGFSH
jgi:hypothetical protein